MVDLPKDVQNWVGEFKGEGLLPVRGYRARMRALQDNVLKDFECAAFYEMLQNSRRPLIYAGGGVIASNSNEELTPVC